MKFVAPWADERRFVSITVLVTALFFVGACGNGRQIRVVGTAIVEGTTTPARGAVVRLCPHRRGTIVPFNKGGFRCEYEQVVDSSGRFEFEIAYASAFVLESEDVGIANPDGLLLGGYILLDPIDGETIDVVLEHRRP